MFSTHETAKTFITNYDYWCSYSFSSNKTGLNEFHESRSDMPLFQWVLALNK